METAWFLLDLLTKIHPNREAVRLNGTMYNSTLFIIVTHLGGQKCIITEIYIDKRMVAFI